MSKHHYPLTDSLPKIGTVETFAVDSLAVQQLIASAIDSGFWSLRKEYGESFFTCRGDVWTDHPWFSITVHAAGRSHEVLHYWGCQAAPRLLKQIESRIDSLANTGARLASRLK